MNDKIHNHVCKWSLIGLFGVAFQALTVGGYWLYRHQILVDTDWLTT
jgi:hypothetical protein